jgi:hypothetical protein
MDDLARTSVIEGKYSGMVANGEKIVTFWKRKKEKVIDISDELFIKNIKEKKPLTVQQFGLH